jgi:hypothetical protein
MLSPKYRHYGPRWLRCGWSEIVNGNGRIVGTVYSVHFGPAFLRLEIKK